MKKVALSAVKDDLSKYLRIAEKNELVITRYGKPAGVLVGFATDEDWFEYRLQTDPRFLQRIERARQSLRSGAGVKLADVPGAKRRRTARSPRKSRGREPD
jgi:prevent-host-death family protein